MERNHAEISFRNTSDGLLTGDTEKAEALTVKFELHNVLAPMLNPILNYSLDTCTVSSDWKTANITPLLVILMDFAKAFGTVLCCDYYINSNGMVLKRESMTG